MPTARQREVSRNSERRRRLLGKAPTPEQQRERYARDPEPRKTAMRSYYADHRDERKKAVSQHYQANRADILARRRKAYAARRNTAATDDLAAAVDAFSVVRSPARSTRIRVGSTPPAGYYRPPDPVELACPACTLEYASGRWVHSGACPLRLAAR